MKKAVLILSALLLLTSLAIAGEKSADQKGKTGCSETCKLTKGSALCVAKHDSLKAAGTEKVAEPKAKPSCAETCKMAKTPAGCAAMKSAASETKSAPCPEHAAATKAADAPAKVEAIAAPVSGEPVKETGETKTPAPTCGEKSKCVELMQFHAAMHPMALALGFEGDEKPDMTKFRDLYPAMKEKTDALAKMAIDETAIKDAKQFAEKRVELVKLVDELGVACKGTDDAAIKPAFEKVHEGYIQLAMLTK